MKAIEFKSKIKGDQIYIPKKIQAELTSIQDKDVRVIVLIDDSELYDSILFKDATRDQFLKGYSESDSVYDN